MKNMFFELIGGSGRQGVLEIDNERSQNREEMLTQSRRASASGHSDKYDPEAHPNPGAEIEAHPKNLVSPVFTCLSNVAAHESIFQSVTNPEITQTGAPAGPPTC